MVNNTIIIGVTETTAVIFEEEFPDLQKIQMTPYNISYSKSIPLFIKLLFDAPRILSVIKKEKQELAAIIKAHDIDLVISDNRFGLYNESVECIYITHQLTMQIPLLGFLANYIHHHYIRKFDRVWVPDFEMDEQCLAGKLSRCKKLNHVEYIGPQSRLSVVKANKMEYDYLCLLSGPEPQRTILETELIQLAQKSNKDICIVRGCKKPFSKPNQSNLTFFDLPHADELSRLIASSKIILCRSGYSTLMDLHLLNKKEIILIPTPGQPEQEYLAEYWNNARGAKVLQQCEVRSFRF